MSSIAERNRQAMEVDDVNQVQGLTTLPRSTSPVVAIAISGSKKSKHIVKWALENFPPEKDVRFKLLHVYPPITTVPTPLGTSIPISQVREDVVTAFRKEVDWQTNEKILPFKLLFLERKLQVDLVQIEADDFANAIVEEVAKSNIKKLVIGASSTGIFTRGHNWSSKISEGTSSFCTVYVVSKGKLSSVRPADSEANGNVQDDKSITSSMTNSPSHDKSSRTERTLRASKSFKSPLSPVHHFQLISTINQSVNSLLDKRKSPSETIQPKSLANGFREWEDYSSSEIKDVHCHISNAYVSSPSRPMPRFQAGSSKNRNPVPRSTSSTRKVHPRHTSPSREGEDDAMYDTRGTDINESYSHIQSSSPPTEWFRALSIKSQIPSHKSIHSSANIKDVSTTYFNSSDVDATNNQASYSRFPSPPPRTHLFRALSLKDPTALRQRAKSSETTDHRYMSRDIREGDDGVSTFSSSFTNRNNSNDSSFRSLGTEGYSISWTTDQPSTSGALTDFSSGSQVNTNFDLEKLRMELEHMQGLYSIAQTEAIDASRKLNNIQKRRLVDAIKLKEMKFKEEEAKEIAKQEKEKHEAAIREADYANECAENEAAWRKLEDTIASSKAKGKEKLENTLASHVDQYQIFSLEEIISATESFSENYRVGMGSYGIVYKCSLRHTTAAVKVLHSLAAPRTKQFQQELEILSKIRHPHLLTLLGACPERGCLIYEYMQNGSLEERLFRRNNTPPLPWFERYRIAHEVASALVFLHSVKPKPIVHRDLKPANILLDHNLVSKIGDVGLSTMVQPDCSALHPMYKDTSPVGTLCYIDPEYQRTGIVSPKSDVYALGMVILQLLTTKPAIALAHTVEQAVEGNNLIEILDREAGEWPLEETNELVMLALKCTEIRQRDRPDLKDQILPTLKKLIMVAEKARDLASNLSTQPPSHFICPLLKDVMNDPCVAADGYTYDRKAIEAWLEENDTSPLTNAPLPHKHLLPNFTFLSAIMDWKSKKH